MLAHASYETPSATGYAAGSFLSGASRLLGEVVGALREDAKDLAADIARAWNGEEGDERVPSEEEKLRYYVGEDDVFSPF